MDVEAHRQDHPGPRNTQAGQRSTQADLEAQKQGPEGMPPRSTTLRMRNRKPYSADETANKNEAKLQTKLPTARTHTAEPTPGCSCLKQTRERHGQDKATEKTSKNTATAALHSSLGVHHQLPSAAAEAAAKERNMTSGLQADSLPAPGVLDFYRGAVLTVDPKQTMS